MAILNIWLPRSNFIYSNNTLLTAGCCKSELHRYLKHWYCLLCPGLVKPIFRHSFGRSWCMRLFHTSRTSFLLTTSLWANSCSGFIFISGKNLRAPSRAFLNSSLRLCPYEIKISMKNFNGFSLEITVLVFTCGPWRQGVLYVIQSLPHPDFGCATRFGEWFRVRPSFPFSPLPHLRSPLPSPLGRPDIQAISEVQYLFFYSPVNLSHPLWFWTFDSLILYITTDKINVEKSKWERVSVASCKFTHGTKLNALEVTCLVC